MTISKNILASLLIILLSFLALLLTNYWWVFIIVCLIVSGAIKLKKGASFWIPFLSIAISFMLYMLWLDTSENELSKMIAGVFQLPSALILIIISSLLYGLLAGFAGWVSYLVLDIFNKHER